MSSPICVVPSDVSVPPCFTVDLDQPASTRWQHVARLYIAQLREVEKQIDSLIDQLIGQWLGPMLAKALSTFIGGVTQLGLVFYGEELKGFARETGIELGRLVLMQFVYECFACCTSIVCRDEQTKIPLHIRTMDWGLDFLKALTIGRDRRFFDSSGTSSSV